MQRNKSWRRSQRERKIQKVYSWVHARNWFGRLGHSASKQFEEYSTEQYDYARRRASAPHPCSRPCCGNPRTHFGNKTRAECQFDISCVEEYSDIGIRKNFNSKRF